MKRLFTKVRSCFFLLKNEVPIIFNSLKLLRKLVIEAKDDNDDLFKNESADLLYHLMVLLEYKNMGLKDIANILENRH